MNALSFPSPINPVTIASVKETRPSRSRARPALVYPGNPGIHVEVEVMRCMRQIGRQARLSAKREAQQRTETVLTRQRLLHNLGNC